MHSSLRFLGPFPEFNGPEKHTSLLVVSYHLSREPPNLLQERMSEGEPLDAEEAAGLFYDHVIRLHGRPLHIASGS